MANGAARGASVPGKGSGGAYVPGKNSRAFNIFKYDQCHGRIDPTSGEVHTRASVFQDGSARAFVLGSDAQ
jgi:hypothetical protein